MKRLALLSTSLILRCTTGSTQAPFRAVYVLGCVQQSHCCSYATHESCSRSPYTLIIPSSHTSSACMLQVVRCTACESLVKPDIVFFGEALPRRFFRHREEDMPECDLLIIMGTSLVVYPFASLQGLVGERCPRLLAVSYTHLTLPTILLV